MISWPQPVLPAGTTIDKYVVQAQANPRNGRWTTIVNCEMTRQNGNTPPNSCDTPMSTFFNKSPFRLEYGDRINIKVTAKGREANGFFPDSEVNSEQIVKTCAPAVVAVPQVTNVRLNASCANVAVSWSVSAPTASRNYIIEATNVNGSTW
jgi:hypothetical protein